MITIFSVRPKGFNVGNDTIFAGLRHLLRGAFDDHVNIVQVPAVGGEEGGMSGLDARTVHEINLYGHGVIVGGGNVYENGQLDVDVNALRALRPPLMLFSTSYGRIYDHRHELVRRTDSMPDAIVTALNEAAAISVARDEATLEHLRGLGLPAPVLGGCPSLLLREVPISASAAPRWPGPLLAVRHPRLMSIPLRDQVRVHDVVARCVEELEAAGMGPVRLLCHDIRDVAFASSLRGREYILADDIHSQLDLLARAPLVVTFRLHAFLPCVSFGTPAVNISYDERSLSLVKTIGLGPWDIDFVRSRDVVAEVRDRCSRLSDLAALRESVQPRWQELQIVMRDSMTSFAALVRAYASEGPPA